MRPSTRLVAVLAALAASLAFTAAPAQAAPTTDFYADSGDRCVYGAAKGTFDWNPPTASILPAVYATGSLIDRPTLRELSVCGNDLMYTVVTFSAYARAVLVDTEAVKADNGTAGINVLLSGRAGVIDTVIVQVCRHSTVPTFAPVDYCGARVAYVRPGIKV
ncbi:hypothetical protein GCM10009682_39920 [Luedemannella flava]|uniref:DUF3757 domain-containing protein n=1 Tax=Luedemannella flava TaxID=349316 RepID=A0ABN2M8Z8_9ACTN